MIPLRSRTRAPSSSGRQSALTQTAPRDHGPRADRLGVQHASPHDHFEHRHHDKGGGPRRARGDVVGDAEAVDAGRPPWVTHTEKTTRAPMPTTHRTAAYRPARAKAPAPHPADAGGQTGQGAEGSPDPARPHSSSVSLPAVGMRVRNWDATHTVIAMGTMRRTTVILWPPDLQDDKTDEGDVHEVIGDRHVPSVQIAGAHDIAPGVDCGVDSVSTPHPTARWAARPAPGLEDDLGHSSPGPKRPLHPRKRHVLRDWRRAVVGSL